MSDLPSVGIVIAAKNAERTIGRAVSTSVTQDHVSEVVVVDDGSSDATLDAASSAAQCSPLLRTITFPENRGPAAARNAALATMTAQAICVVDADDYLLPGRIARMAPHFAGCDFLADDMYYSIGPDGPVLERGLFSLAPGETQWLTLGDFIDRSISRPGRPRGEIAFIKPLMSADFLKTRRIAYREPMRLGEDFALYADALHAGARFRLMEACGYVSVERRDSLSAVHSIADLANFLAFDDDLLRRDLAKDVRRSLELHRYNTAVRLAHRQILDYKRRRDLGGLARLLVQSPKVALGAARAIARDKLGR